MSTFNSYILRNIAQTFPLLPRTRGISWAWDGSFQWWEGGGHLIKIERFLNTLPLTRCFSFWSHRKKIIRNQRRETRGSSEFNFWGFELLRATKERQVKYKTPKYL